MWVSSDSVKGTGAVWAQLTHPDGHGVEAARLTWKDRVPIPAYIHDPYSFRA